MPDRLQTWSLAGIFSKMNKNEPVTLRMATDSIVASDKIQTFRLKSEFLENLSIRRLSAVSWTASQYFKTFLISLVVILKSVAVLILCNEICQILKALLKSASQFFCMANVTESCLGKRAIQSAR